MLERDPSLRGSTLGLLYPAGLSGGAGHIKRGAGEEGKVSPTREMNTKYRNGRQC